MLSKACKLIVTVGIYCAGGCNLIAQDQTSKSQSQSQYRFRHFTTDDGLPNGSILSIRTDSLGYVWCQYANGLSRFDGYNFKVFQYDEYDPNRSTLDFNITRLLKDATGNIWLRQWHPGDSSPIHLAKYNWKSDRFDKHKINVKGAVVFLRFEKDNSAIWAARDKQNGLLRYDPKSGEALEFKNPHGDSAQMKLHNSIGGFMVYDSYLLLSTAGGLWIFDKKSHAFRRPPCDPKDSAFLFHSRIGWFLSLKNSEDEKSLWLRNGESFVKIDSSFSIVRRAKKMKAGINHSDSDREGLWHSYPGEGGLFHYNLEEDSLTNIQAEPGNKFALQSNTIFGVALDRDNSLWVGTPHGIDHLMRRNVNYHNVNLTDLHSSILYNAGEKEYLIWNQGGKLLSAPLDENFDLKNGLKEIALPFKDAVISGFWKGEKYLWASTLHKVGSSAGGVFGFPINPKTGLVEDHPLLRFENQSNDSIMVSSQIWNDVWESGDGDLWLTHPNAGLSRVDLGVPYGSQGSVTRYTHVENDTNSIVSNSAYSFFPEDKHSVWVMTFVGVDLLHFDESKHVTFEHVFTRPSFLVEVADVLFRTQDGNLFLGTSNGLYQASKKTGRYVFNPISILGRRSFNAIQEDQLGRLWLKTNKILICFDRKEGTVIEFNERDGIDHLRSLEFARLESHDAMHRMNNGWLMLRDPDGATFFDPMSFRVDTKPVVPVLTSLLVNNQTPQIGDNQEKSEKYTIPYHVGALSELVLDYTHNNFSLEFSAMEMTAPEKNRYRHKLENYDKEWIETDFKNRTATYTNLDPGNYIFKVRASNHHGVWSDKETTLAVVILPPPWQTWWAYMSYSLLGIGLLVLARKIIVQRERLKSNLMLAKVEQEKEHFELEKAREIDKVKTSFFANISHEFRTPITLLLGPLKEMYMKAKNNEDRSTINMMIKNGQRLLRLINQLLDLSKLEAGKMTLCACQLDVVQFIKEITSSYESWALHKKIKYTFYPEMHELTAYVDQEKIEKVVHNLLSNAFKFTPEGGEVIVHLREPDKEWFQIIVKDSGIGIPPEQQAKIFGRFYQVDSSKTREYEGSGLGMAFAKELVELHHGKISVTSTEGKGTTFTVQLPIGKEHYAETELVDIAWIRQTGPEYFEPSVTRSMDEVEKYEMSLNGDQPLLLIVEDNDDMRHYIQRILSDQYQIDVAVDGKEGISKAEQIVPDLIISDVMMPEMDGYELCKRIKSNELTSHIPVILLTTKADRESKLDGLETGADDYLSKPFDVEELKLIVRNRINEIRRLRDRFSREITLEPRKIAITSLDEKFLTKVLGIIEEHMHEEAFSLDDLSLEVGYSSMHFYRKLKALAGQTPGAFLKTIRLKRAAELLAKNSDNVNQVAYSVGFSSPSYFNKCFKEQFGVTPGQYAESVPKS